MVEKIKIVAIVGAGAMGQQIVERTAMSGYSVRVYDTVRDFLEKFVRRMNRKKKMKGISGEITLHNTLTEAVKDADLIIEAVPEKLELKKEIFSQIDKAAPSHAIIATNSSSIPVSRIEGVVDRKENVLNIHFYNIYALPMADIMKGTETTDDTFEIGVNFVQSIDITPIILKKESFGFVFNRMWRSVKKDCLKMWAEGVADIKTIDKAWKIFTKMGVGPFEIMDNVGLDVTYDVEMSYYKESGDPNDKPPQELKDLIERGDLGRKTGKGFYKYYNS
ncbi:MAG: 3-hydroxyacyl-CoA dehydrogenase family protein [Candidatus Odinarchaeota archaeon]